MHASLFLILPKHQKKKLKMQALYVQPMKNKKLYSFALCVIAMAALIAWMDTSHTKLEMYKK